MKKTHADYADDADKNRKVDVLVNQKENRKVDVPVNQKEIQEG